MLTVHYTIHERKDVAKGSTTRHEGNNAQAIINALIRNLGQLENLTLPYYSADLGVTVTVVSQSDKPIVVATTDTENPNA